jgi:hypothetical protein
MVSLPLTVSEIYGVIVRPLTSMISGTAEPIEFKLRQLVDYVDLYKLLRSEGYISETVRDRHAQNRQHLVTFLKNVTHKLDETLPDGSTVVTDIWAKYEEKLLSGFRDISGQCDLNLTSENFQKSISRERFDRLS